MVPEVTARGDGSVAAAARRSELRFRFVLDRDASGLDARLSDRCGTVQYTEHTIPLVRIDGPH